MNDMHLEIINRVKRKALKHPADRRYALAMYVTRTASVFHDLRRWHEYGGEHPAIPDYLEKMLREESCRQLGVDIFDLLDRAVAETAE